MFKHSDESRHTVANEAVIEAIGISKTFGGAKALTNVSIRGVAGSIHAVTGENGAGKSTLMKILSGVHRPDAGELHVSGKIVKFHDSRAAREHGISTVFQEFTLLPNLSVAENLFLGREPGPRGWVNIRQMKARAKEILAALGVDIDPTQLAGQLSVGEQQLVEIAKGFATDASVFIFDEPTAALNGPEVEKLKSLIRSLKERGKAVFYISHRLEEIFSMCDTVTVLKDGTHVATLPTSELDERSLVTLMVGRQIDDLFPPRATQVGGNALRCDSVHPSDANRSFRLNRREIVGIAGLEGQGQRELLRSVAGVLSSQELRLEKCGDGSKTHVLDPASGVRGRLRQGVGFLPGDRKSEGLYLDLSIAENIAISTYQGSSLGAYASPNASLISNMMKHLGLRAKSPRSMVQTLSGGNQQKALLARALISEIDVLVIEEPTRGVDIGAKTEIYRLLRSFTEDNGAVLVSSSELPELIGLCDRILVVRGGHIVATIDGQDATEELVMSYALGTSGPHLKEAA
ncbi:sugar ABC transporter ATP-binding protein [Paraburkholderia caribensis]|uniref:sugar ABC transporter ATP-binding protein n=1 Tax=Paraburkholderia caribensis TaxID=75105 RepID=UPI001CB45509|nr:sugar ABC transporter ATP-binding protein [Paraburkholderia caribensis]CAG9243753.1 Ribose import ATP-binding protein RbsA 3 [Paraburkholderia caribensis]